MMPRIAKELSALEVGRLTKPGYHFVGGVPGLALQVVATGARTWILRARVGGKRRDIGLGGYPAVTLAGAREAAREKRSKIQEGMDPVEDGRIRRSALAAERARAMTFRECATAFISTKQAEWANAKHAAQWTATIATYAEPTIGNVLVKDIETSHIIRVLEPIWNVKTETASRLRGRIESVLDWATVSGYRKGDNPARWRGHLDKLLASPKKIQRVEHHAAVPFAEMSSFMQALRKASGVGARALEFAILTAARSGEVRGAVWSEIDLKNSLWTIPAQRMKAKREHRVPLTREVIQLLKKLPQGLPADLVFTTETQKQLSDATLTAVLKRMGRDETAHGFRSTFRDWASECTNYSREVCEMALAHTIGDAVEAAYRRGDLFEKRIALMRDWAAFCGSETPRPAHRRNKGDDK
jgi:integrase